MTKLLILVLVVLIVYWLGRQSVRGSVKEVEKKKPEDESEVIDIEIEE